MDKARLIAQSIFQSVQNIREEEIEQPNWHTTALAKLADIFKEKTKQIRKVKSTIIQMSATPTSPAAIHNTPRVHQQKTRSKTPSIVPPNSGGGLTTQVSAEKATVRAPDCYETSRNKSSRTRVRTMASSKRNITTISKPVHVPVNRKIIDLKTPLSEIRKITQPQRVLIEDRQDVTSVHTPHPQIQNTRMISQEPLT